MEQAQYRHLQCQCSLLPMNNEDHAHHVLVEIIEDHFMGVQAMINSLEDFVF